MPLDSYSLCPGGTGKKIKFCCPDLVGDLEKLSRMLEGDQRVAAMDLVEKLDDKTPGRACLMAVRCMLENGLQNHEAAAQTVAKFLKAYPDNPIALAESALSKVLTGHAMEAIAPLQRALEVAGGQVPVRVYEAIGAVGQGLLAQGHILAARGHLALQAGIAPEDDTRALEILMRMNASPAVPVMFKDDPHLAACKDDAPWKKDFDEARTAALRGTWMTAAKRFMALAEKHPKAAEAWINLARMRCWLADEKGAIGALRTYVLLDVPWDDAVEAEGLAQLLDEDAIGPAIDVLTITYPVTNPTELESRLTASRQASTMPVDLATLAEEGEPPPRAAYWLLDRPMPRSGEGLTRGDVPYVLGQFYFFGKQTDRDARLEVVLFRDASLEQAKKAMAEIVGDAIGAATKEEVTAHTSASRHTMTFNWRLPDDTPVDARRTLVADEGRELILNRWPKIPMRLFGGKSPEQVAGDASLRIRLAAAVLLLQLSNPPSVSDEDFNALRERLKLPKLEPIDPTGVVLADLPLARLVRLEASKLTDEQLLGAYQRAAYLRVEPAIKKLALELVARPSLANRPDFVSEAYHDLAAAEGNSPQALVYLEKGRELAKAARQSCASWDLAELSLRLERHETAEASRLIEHIGRDHRSERGVAQALMTLLYEAGLVAPDGRWLGRPPEEGSPLMVPGGETAAAGKLWTPGGEQATGEKKTLWTPGME